MPLQLATKARIEQLQKDLQQAVDRAFNPGATPYKKVTVILCHFNNDDLNVIPLEDELAETFKDVYGYNILRWTMMAYGSKDPGITLTRFLDKGIEHGIGEEGCLVIIVFSGHGEVKTIGRIQVLHVGGAVDRFGKFRGKSVEWKNATTILQLCKADVLHILDCCFAGAATNHNVETLAATSSTEVAAADAQHCFTRALNTQLRLSASQGAITVANLYASMIKHLPALQLQYMPVYVPREGQPSIILQKMSFRGKVKHVDLPPDGPRVLVTVHVDGKMDQKRNNDIKKWLVTNIPEHVKGMKIKLDGAWRASSSVLLFSIPIQIWTQIEGNPAYRMVEIVYGDNLAIVETPSTTLAIRPLSGSENQDPSQGSPLK